MRSDEEIEKGIDFDLFGIDEEIASIDDLIFCCLALLKLNLPKESKIMIEAIYGELTKDYDMDIDPISFNILRAIVLREILLIAQKQKRNLL